MLYQNVKISRYTSVFSAIFTKGKNFCDFLLASLQVCLPIRDNPHALACGYLPNRQTNHGSILISVDLAQYEIFCVEVAISGKDGIRPSHLFSFLDVYSTFLHISSMGKTAAMVGS